MSITWLDPIAPETMPDDVVAMGERHPMRTVTHAAARSAPRVSRPGRSATTPTHSPSTHCATARKAAKACSSRSR